MSGSTREAKSMFTKKYIKFRILCTPGRATLRKISWGCLAEKPKPFPIYEPIYEIPYPI